MKNKKILLINAFDPYWYDGTSNYNYKLINIFLELGYDIDYVYLYNTKKRVRKELHYINILDNPKTKFILFNEMNVKEKFFRYFIFNFKMKQWLNKINHNDYQLIINSSRIFSKLNKKKNYIHVQHNSPDTYNLKIYPFLKRVIYKTINSLLKNKNSLEKSANVVLFDKFNAIKSNNNKFYIKLSVYNKNSMQMEKINERDGILFIGRQNDIQKNYNLFLKIAKENPNINFYTIGQKSEFHEKLDNIHHYGVIDNEMVLKIIKKHKYLLNVSKYEGFPYSIVEALSSGVPSIILKSFPSSEELTCYDNSLLLDNTIDISKKINFIYNKPNYNKIANRAIEYARNNLSNEHFKKLWKEILVDITHK